MDVKINLQDGKLVHEQKLKDRKQSIASDAASVAWFIVRHKLEAERQSESYNSDPEDVIRRWSEEGQRQWTYALVEDDKYVRSVGHKASLLVRQILDDIKHNKGKLVSLFPAPAAPGGGGGGGEAGGGEGLAGLFGSTKSTIKTALAQDPDVEADGNGKIVITATDQLLIQFARIDQMSPEMAFWANTINIHVPDERGRRVRFGCNDDEIRISGPSVAEFNSAVLELHEAYPKEVDRLVRHLEIDFESEEDRQAFILSLSRCVQYSNSCSLFSTCQIQIEGVVAAMDGSRSFKISETVKAVMEGIGKFLDPRLQRIMDIVNQGIDQGPGSPGIVIVSMPASLDMFYREEIVEFSKYGHDMEDMAVALGGHAVHPLVAKLKQPNDWPSSDNHRIVLADLKGKCLYRLGHLIALAPGAFQRDEAEVLSDSFIVPLMEELARTQSSKNPSTNKPSDTAAEFRSFVRLLDANDEELLAGMQALPARWKVRVATLAASQKRHGFMQGNPQSWYAEDPHASHQAPLSHFSYVSPLFYKMMDSAHKTEPKNVDILRNLSRVEIKEQPGSLRDPGMYQMNAMFETKDLGLCRSLLSNFTTSSEAESMAFSIICEDGTHEDYAYLAEQFIRKKPPFENTRATWASVCKNANKIANTPLGAAIRTILGSQIPNPDAYLNMQDASLLTGDVYPNGESKFSRSFGMTIGGNSKEEVLADIHDLIIARSYDAVIGKATDLVSLGAKDDLVNVMRSISQHGCQKHHLVALFRMLSRMSKSNNEENSSLASEFGYLMSPSGQLMGIDDMIMQGNVPEERLETLSISNPEMMAAYFSTKWAKDPEQAKRLISRLSPQAKATVRPFLYSLPESLFYEEPAQKPDIEAAEDNKDIIVATGHDVATTVVGEPIAFVYDKNNRSGDARIRRWTDYSSRMMPDENGKMLQFVLPEKINIPADKARNVIASLDDIMSINQKMFLAIETSCPKSLSYERRTEIASLCSFEMAYIGDFPQASELVPTMIDGVMAGMTSHRSLIFSEQSLNVLKAIGGVLCPKMMEIQRLINEATHENVITWEYVMPTSIWRPEDKPVAVPVTTLGQDPREFAYNILELLEIVKRPSLSLEVRNKAALRMGHLFAVSPDLFEQNDISSALKDADVMAASWLRRLMLMRFWDDDKFSTEYVNFAPEWRPCVATLAATQNRTQIIKEHPAMWLSKNDDDEYYMSMEFFLKTDKTNPTESHPEIMTFLSDRPMTRYPEDVQTNDILLHTLFETKDIELARDMMTQAGMFPEAFSFMCQHGDKDDMASLLTNLERWGELVSDSDSRHGNTMNKYMWAAIISNSDRIIGTPLAEMVANIEIQSPTREYQALTDAHWLVSDDVRKMFCKTFKLNTDGDRPGDILNSFLALVRDNNFININDGFKKLFEFDDKDSTHTLLVAALRAGWRPLSYESKGIEKFIGHEGMEMAKQDAGFVYSWWTVDDLLKNPGLCAKVPDDKLNEVVAKNITQVVGLLSELVARDPDSVVVIFNRLTRGNQGMLIQYMPNWRRPSPPAPDVEARSTDMIRTASSKWESNKETAYFCGLARGNLFPWKEGYLMHLHRAYAYTEDELEHALDQLLASEEDRNKAVQIGTLVLEAAENVARKVLRDDASVRDFMALATEHSLYIPNFLEAKSSGAMSTLLLNAFGASHQTRNFVKEWASLSGRAIDDIVELATKMKFTVMVSPYWPSNGGLDIGVVPQDAEWRTWSSEPSDNVRNENFQHLIHLPTIRFAMAKNIAQQDALRLARAALNTLVMFPDYYERSGFTDEELDRHRATFPLAKNIFEFIRKMRKAIRSDDAYLMELWAGDHEPLHRKAIADLAARQKRLAIVMGNPTMWYNETRDEVADSRPMIDNDHISCAFFKMTDMKHPDNAKKVVAMMNAKGRVSNESRMLYSALIRSGSPEIAKEIANDDTRRNFGLSASDVMVALLAIDSTATDNELHEYCLAGLRDEISREHILRNMVNAVVQMAPTNNSEDILGIIRENARHIYDHSDVWRASLIAGKAKFSRFSRATGLSSQGRPFVDLIREMIESPFALLDREVLTMLRDFEDNGDVDNVIQMLRAELGHKVLSKPNIVSSILDACKRMGIEDKSMKALFVAGAEVYDGVVYFPEIPSSQFFNRMPMSVAVGILEEAFEKNKVKAIKLLQDYPLDRQGELLSYLSLAIRTHPASPAWVRQSDDRDVEAMILPNGKVILGQK